MRGIEQIPENSRELRRDFDRAKVFDCNYVLKFRQTTDLSIIHNWIKLKEQMDEENIST